MTCAHCRRRRAVQGELCGTCFAQFGDEADVDRSALPGNGRFRCLWCGHRVLDGPLGLCCLCQGKCDRRKAEARRRAPDYDEEEAA